MFTPEQLNDVGYEMEKPYSKVSDNGWSVGYPEAENYQVSPIDGSPLDVVYAYEALGNTITVSNDNPTVSAYGSEEKGISEATSSVVTTAVKKNGYDPVKIAQAVNRAISIGSIVGVEYVDASDINVRENIKAVGVYYTAAPNGKSAPVWSLPIDSSVFDILGNVQTVIGVLLILLAVFRSTLIKSYFRRR